MSVCVIAIMLTMCVYCARVTSWITNTLGWESQDAASVVQALSAVETLPDVPFLSEPSTAGVEGSVAVCLHIHIHMLAPHVMHVLLCVCVWLQMHCESSLANRCSGPCGSAVPGDSGATCSLPPSCSAPLPVCSSPSCLKHSPCKEYYWKAMLPAVMVAQRTRRSWRLTLISCMRRRWRLLTTARPRGQLSQKSVGRLLCRRLWPLSALLRRLGCMTWQPHLW